MNTMTTSTAGTISRFEQALINSMDWMREVQEALGLDEQDTYQCLRAVLHALRDRLPPAEVAALGSRLPLVVRGIFYEGWTPAERAEVAGEGFLGDVDATLRQVGGLEVDPREAARGVLGVLGRTVPKAELDRVVEASPAVVRELLAG